MKRLRVMQFLCCLSLMLFVTCSEAFSIKASAYTASYPFFPIDTKFAYYANGNQAGMFSPNKDNVYSINYTSSSSFFRFEFSHNNDQTGEYSIWSFPYFENYDYYYVFNVYGYNYEIDNGFPVTAYSFYDGNQFITDYNSGTFYPFLANDAQGFTYVLQHDINVPPLAGIYIDLTSYPLAPGTYCFEGGVLAVPRDTSQQQIDSIITAIQNQTSELGSAIGDAADQVTDKIDEVLTPEGDHNFDEVIGDVNDKINENMGALGFAHDTVAQFADLFTETPGAPVITVPPLKMSIKGQEYEFFHGYQYDFRSLETGPLAILVAAVRTAGTIVLWLAFLSYCSKEFNNFFRR